MSCLSSKGRRVGTGGMRFMLLLGYTFPSLLHQHLSTEASDYGTRQAAGGDKPATLELMSGSNEMELLRNVVIYVFQLYWSGKGRNDLDQLVSAVNLVSKMYASGGSAELLAEYADHGYLLSGHGNTGL
ncbi:hypothetical protein BDR26DRAFT_915474 [Obelidium mucronatum]|nr:hypothetical protein BDR26DRAFT_915474 [Obelidium mucronatum]